MKNPASLMLVPLLAMCSTSLFAEVEGIYTTVTESACNEEVHVLPEGTGKIVATCRLEDGSQNDAVSELGVTWVLEGDVLVMTSESMPFSFTLSPSLSCAPFGRAGSSPGIVGRGKSYWRSPVACE